MNWLNLLEEREPKVFAKCLAKLLLLEKLGNELRRPHADSLRDSIFELRQKVQKVHYRMLYFFCGQNIACISHGFSKKGKVPDGEIEYAIEAMKLVKADKNKHTSTFGD